jgi:hypothetical protein
VTYCATTYILYLFLGKGDSVSALTDKVEGLFREYDVAFHPPDNIYRLGRDNGAPICVVFSSEAIQEKVLGKFNRRDMRVGDSVEAKLPHGDRSKRATIRGIGAGKPDRDYK